MTEFGIGTWKTRDGRKAVVESIESGRNLPLVGNIDGKRTQWTEDGGFYFSGYGHDADLIAPWVAPAEYPDADGWIKWYGGECPVLPETIVETRHRGVDNQQFRAGSFWWDHRGKAGDIIAYRVVEPVAEPKAAAFAAEFWMVFLEGGSAPRVKHASFEAAYEEATRLVKQTGCRAWVLEPVSSVATGPLVREGRTPDAMLKARS